MRVVSVGVGLLALALWASTASAAVLTGQLFLDPSSPDLTTGCTIPCPFVDVTVDLQDPATAHVRFTARSNSAGLTFGLGGVGGGGGPLGNIVGLSLFELGGTMPTITVTDITATYMVGTSADTNGVHHVPFGGGISGVGDYNVVLTWGDDSSHGSTALLSELSFTINNLSGTWSCLRDTDSCPTPLIDNDENAQSWTNSLTGQNDFTSPSWAMAHLSRCSTESLAANDTCGQTEVVTAWAGGAAVTTLVPEPGTIALLGCGLLLMGLLARRIWK